jgi:adenylosuccinate synthase
LSCLAVVGLQWGDEGKGKIVDILSEDVDVIARYQGGPNAGHTVVVDDTTFILHIIPTGILREGKICLVGNGAVIDLDGLGHEIESLKQNNISVDGRLFISQGAHLILPYHKAAECVEESTRPGGPIGTTGRGIGPAYCDKAARTGIRVADLREPDVLSQKVGDAMTRFRERGGGGSQAPELKSTKEIVEGLRKWAEKLDPMIADTTGIINDALDSEKRVLLEGAQGVLLDIDHGTYPFVTSSSAGVGGACSGLGIAPSRIDHVVGVAKAYVTRVGNGPFPSESSIAEAEFLRDEGKEYGATTGRPRRCGWFDAVAVRYAARISGLSSLAVTKLDVLDRMERIGLCVAYIHRNERFTEFSPDLRFLLESTPEIEYVDGWMQDTTQATSLEALPANARRFLDRLEELAGVPIGMVSVGQLRKQVFSVQV